MIVKTISEKCEDKMYKLIMVIIGKAELSNYKL